MRCCEVVGITERTVQRWRVDERDKPRGSEQPGLAGQLAAGRVMTDDPGDRTKK